MACGSISQGASALNCAFLLEICSWSRRGLWDQTAGPPADTIVPRMVKRALGWEAGALGLILVPPVTHFVALQLSLGSS